MNTTSDVLGVDIDFHCEQYVSEYNSSCDPYCELGRDNCVRWLYLYYCDYVDQNSYIILIVYSDKCLLYCFVCSLNKIQFF